MLVCCDLVAAWQPDAGVSTWCTSRDSGVQLGHTSLKSAIRFNHMGNQFEKKFKEVFRREVMSISNRSALPNDAKVCAYQMPPRIRTEIGEMRTADDALRLVESLAAILDNGLILGLLGVDLLKVTQEELRRQLTLVLILVYGDNDAGDNLDQQITRLMESKARKSVSQGIQDLLIEWVFELQYAKLDEFLTQPKLTQRRSAEFFAVSALLLYLARAGVDVNRPSHVRLGTLVVSSSIFELTFDKLTSAHKEYGDLDSFLHRKGYHPAYTTGLREEELPSPKTLVNEENDPSASEIAILSRIRDRLTSKSRAIISVFAKQLMLENNREEPKSLNSEHLDLLDQYADWCVASDSTADNEAALPARLPDCVTEITQHFQAGNETFNDSEAYWGSHFESQVKSEWSNDEKQLIGRIFLRRLPPEIRLDNQKLKSWHRKAYLDERIARLGGGFENLGERIRMAPRLPIPELAAIQQNAKDVLQFVTQQSGQGAPS